MAEKVKVNIVSGEKKTSKAGKTYFMYKDAKGVSYCSSDELKEGEGEYFMTSKESEYNGKPQTSYFLAKEEYKPTGNKKPYQQFPPKKDYAIVECALKIVGHLEDLKIIAKPTTEDQLFEHIVRTIDRIKALLK